MTSGAGASGKRGEGATRSRSVMRSQVCPECHPDDPAARVRDRCLTHGGKHETSNAVVLVEKRWRNRCSCGRTTLYVFESRALAERDAQHHLCEDHGVEHDCPTCGKKARS